MTFDEKIKDFQKQKDELKSRQDQLTKDTEAFRDDFQAFMKEQFDVKDGDEFHLTDIIVKARTK